MTKVATSLLVLLTLAGCTIPAKETKMTSSATVQQADEQQHLIDLSRQKWLWMADRNVAELDRLFHPSARFVHMGATMDKVAELDVIREGKIQYKHADISEVSAEMQGDTAVVYSRLRLVAVVGGNEVSNPFSVTETFVRQGDRWQLAAMAFTRLLGE
jgi:Domain of unknown function (DUF4440)